MIINFKYLGLILLLITCSVKQSDDHLKDLEGANQSVFAQWRNSFTNFNSKDFKLTDIRKFDNNSPQDFEDYGNFLDTYQPIVSFSPDSSSFIDIYSYQLNLEKKDTVYLATVDIDQAIYLCDYKQKYWDRIFFGTPSRSIDESIWTSDSTFILAGVATDSSWKRHPFLLLGNTKTQRLKVFENTNAACIRCGDYYRSPRLENLSIRNL